MEALAKDERWIVLEIMMGKLVKLPMFKYDGRMCPWACGWLKGGRRIILAKCIGHMIA
jgi:hypothetical protein